MNFLTDPDNIGVEILVLSSAALISNIGLLTAKSLTGEPNEKEPTFNEEPSPDNDEVQTIFISYFCVFEKIMVYRRGLLEKRCKYTWIPARHSSFKKFKNIQVTHLIIGGSRKNFTKMKSSIYFNNGILQQTITDGIKFTADDSTYIIGPTTANQKFETNDHQ